VSLVYLDYSHAQASLLGQSFSHFSARLRAYFEGRLEGTPLLCGQDGSWAFWTSPTVLRSGGRHKIVTRIFACNNETKLKLNSLKIHLLS
jgi:hypothetical protein